MNSQNLIENVKISLRPARPNEEAFLFQVYASTRAIEMTWVDWTPEQKEAFLQMQSTAQLKHYRLNYPQAEYQIIEENGVAIGRLIVDRSKNPILLMDIALLPEYQGKGIGTTLIQNLMGEAARKNWPLCLHVETFNPAMRLYRRLGFVESGEMGIYHEMTWLPLSSQS
jgi:GNAT superfamily N-acetyltransferase